MWRRFGYFPMIQTCWDLSQTMIKPESLLFMCLPTIPQLNFSDARLVSDHKPLISVVKIEPSSS